LQLTDQTTNKHVKGFTAQCPTTYWPRFGSGKGNAMATAPLVICLFIGSRL